MARMEVESTIEIRSEEDKQLDATRELEAEGEKLALLETKLETRLEDCDSLAEVLKFFDDDNGFVVKKLQANGLLPTHAKCGKRECKQSLSVRKGKFGKAGWGLYCKKCRKTSSICTGTFFEKSQLPFAKILELMFLWSCQASVGVARDITGIPSKSVVQYNQYIRDICSWRLMRSPEAFRFGGDGLVVQIDECVATKRSEDKDDPATKDQWLLGIYDCSTGRGVIVYVADREPETLASTVTAHVLPGSIVWSDRRRSYEVLDRMGGVSPYVHRTVDNAHSFVDAETGVCINAVKSYWAKLKGYCQRRSVMDSRLLPSHIDEFLWDDLYGRTRQKRFASILNDIRERYPCN